MGDNVRCENGRQVLRVRTAVVREDSDLTQKREHPACLGHRLTGKWEFRQSGASCMDSEHIFGVQMMLDPRELDAHDSSCSEQEATSLPALPWGSGGLLTQSHGYSC